LDDRRTTGAIAGTVAASSDTEGLALDAKRGQTPDSSTGVGSSSSSDFTVIANEQLATGALATGDESQGETIEPDFLLWDNPKAKTDRMVILGSKSIIYANPAASDIPHILGLFDERKMLRDLLGEDAGTIKLDTIQRLTANPERANLNIDYKPNEKTVTHQLTFSNAQARDEALDALQLRLGADFNRTTRKFSLADKILLPLLIIVLVAVIGWVLLIGISYLEGAAGFQSGILQLILINTQYYVDLIGPSNILMIAIVLVALCLVWLVINLSKPSSLLIVERK
jgi:hypothetical protein